MIPPKCTVTVARFLAAALLFLFHAVAFAVPGDIDFVNKTRVPNGNNEALAAAVQPDGKIVTAGYARYGNIQFSIVRYNVNGTLDTTFNATGYVLEPLGSWDATATGVAIGTNGTVTAGGWGTNGFQEQFAIARFTASGALDVPFGGGGALTAVGEGNARSLGIALQPSDGKVVLAGWAMQGGKKVFAMVRYNLNAVLDSTFGTSGRVLTAIGSGDSQANAVAIQADGKILLAGSSAGNLAVARYNTNGTLDTTFASGTGIRTVGTPFVTAKSIALQPDGKILVGGNASSGSGTAFGFVRLDAAGNLDTTFNGTGAQTVAFPSGDTADMHRVIVLPDGTIRAAGYVQNAGTGTVGLVSLNANGTLDTTFSGGGVVPYTVEPKEYRVGDMALMADGRLAVAGGVQNASYDEVLAVFHANGSLDTTFQTSGHRDADLGSALAGAFGVALQPDGKIVAAGTVTYEAPQSGQSIMVARYNTNGTLDATFGTGGYVLYPPAPVPGSPGYTANAVALQSDGKIVVAGTEVGMGRIAVARFNVNGTLDTGFAPTPTPGIRSFNVGEQDVANAVKVLADGRIVVAGRTTSPGGSVDSFFARITAAGGGDGQVVLPMGTGVDQLNNFTVMADGRLLGIGTLDVSSSQSAFGLVRVNPDLTVDTTFGNAGYVTTTFNTSGWGVGRGVAIQPDGRIVAAGYAFTGSNDNVALARYNADGSLDAGFGSGGKVLFGISGHVRGFDVALLPSGKIDVVGEWSSWGVIAQFLPNGAVDTSYALGGYAQANLHWGHDQLWSVARQADGNLVMAADATGVFAVVRVIGDTSSVAAPRKVKRDFNHDGKSDIVWQNSDGTQVSWLMDGTSVTGGLQLVGAGTGWAVKLTADFDGNGTADILWQHADGTVVMWLMDGTTVTGGATVMGAGTGWTPQLTGDFDGDGRADLVWRNADGRQHLWLMDGTTITGGAQLVGAGSGWTVKQLVDLDGDGKSDILFQHADGTVIAWLMNGASQITSASLVGAGGWSPIQVGDFNGDGKGDILWRHTDGTVIAWLMNGTSQLSSRVLVTAGPWTVTKVGDFNGDGKSDLVWRNTTDGTIIQWLMNGTTPTETPVLVGAGSGWDVRALEDFNGDGNADIVWQHTDGTTVAWLMSGASVVSGTQLVGAGTGWSVMP